MTQVVSDSIIIAAYGWSDTSPIIAWKLGTNTNRISHVWGRAKREGLLPPGKRPPGGFDLRQSALLQTMSLR
jgi:hypothetical protein